MCCAEEAAWQKKEGVEVLTAVHCGTSFADLRCNTPSFYGYTEWHKKTGTSEMHGGSHVQLAALRNRDFELVTTSPFSNHGSVERSTACFRHKNVSIFVGVFKSSHFFVSPCRTLHINTYEVCVHLMRETESSSNSECTYIDAETSNAYFILLIKSTE